MDITNFAFPNDMHVHWSMMIALYPFLSGLVDGAFVISALYYVFGYKSLRPICRFALLFAMAFLLCVTLPLLNHLGHPERNINMLVTPSPTSAMSGFGYIYSVYAVILGLQILFIYRSYLVEVKERSKGVIKLFYEVLTIASSNVSPKALELDARIIRFLAIIGIPGAIILHGYVGFIFGGVKANPTWSTPLMPVIFLLSACVSGIAGVLLAYVLIKKITGKPIDMACVRTCINVLTAFFIFDFVFEMLEIFSHAYLHTWHYQMVDKLMAGPLYNSFWVGQVYIFSVIPLAILAYIIMVRVKDRAYVFFASVASFMLLIQVILMRWNVVIGGQLISKSHRGFAEFHPEWIHKEGILAVLGIMILPLVILFVLSKIFPFWPDDANAGPDGSAEAVEPA